MRNPAYSTTGLYPATACRRSRSIWLPLLLLLAPTLSSAVQAQFNYTKANGAITITGIIGVGGDVTAPADRPGRFYRFGTQ